MLNSNGFRRDGAQPRFDNDVSEATLMTSTLTITEAQPEHLSAARRHALRGCAEAGRGKVFLMAHRLAMSMAPTTIACLGIVGTLVLA